MTNIFILFFFIFITPFQILAKAGQKPSRSMQIENSKLLLHGLIKFTGSHFQSCMPLLKYDDDPVDILKDFWNSEESLTKSRQCYDRRNDNFNYVSFSWNKGSLEPTAGQLKLDGGSLDAFGRFNCSGFVAGIMAASGFKYSQSQSDLGYSPTTEYIHKEFKSEDSCFFRPEISKEMSLLPGDLINVSAAHVVMVYTVGKDPLGLKNIKKKSQCENISKKNFDFTIVHSSSEDKGDFSGVRIEEASKASTNLIKKLEGYTQKFCKERFSKSFSGTLKDDDTGDRTYGWSIFSIKKTKYWALRRHFGRSKRGCFYHHLPKVNGEKCLRKKCYQQVKNKAMGFQ